jgi:murein DD-endopeptidase MepM/ murein hydrolase activator NlpD
VANKLLRGDIERSWIAAAGDGRPPPTLRFPVAGGTAGRGWGSGPGNYHLAFDIPGKIGARVSAAAPGIVAYAGDELAGYGKVVMIIHRGGLVTVYAHNSELKTVAGERVKAGTRIALLGSSGISRGPHVHFEVIYQGKLCDPVPLVRPVPRTGSGKLVLKQRDLETWPRRGGPPKGLNCATRRRHPAYVGHPYGWRPPCWPNCAWDAASGREDQEDVDLPEETLGPDAAEEAPDAPTPPEQ